MMNNHDKTIVLRNNTSHRAHSQEPIRPEYDIMVVFKNTCPFATIKIIHWIIHSGGF